MSGLRQKLAASGHKLKDGPGYIWQVIRSMAVSSPEFRQYYNPCGDGVVVPEKTPWQPGASLV
jgi:hypothetical protein